MSVRMVKAEINSRIEEMMESTQCAKNFVCYKSGFKTLCKARDIGLDSFVACLMHDPLDCKFSLLFGGVFFCTCAVRIFIAKNLQK